jgi:hypothetical protein
MDLQSQSKAFLKHAYSQLCKQTDQRISPIQLIELHNLDETETIRTVNYLKSNHYIENVRNQLGSHLPLFFTLSASGIDWMNGYGQEETIIQNFHFKDNYGAVGTNTNFTINNSFSFEKLDELIKAHTAELSVDRAELVELQNQLKTITEHKIPISEGYLNKFSSAMQKHSWLTGQLAGFLIRWAVGV